MLRLFRDVLEDKTIDMEKAGKLLDEDFAKDVNFRGYTDELLLLEVDNMTDMLYEKQGSYLQGKAEGREEGRVEGRVEGREEGREEARKEERQLAETEKLESARNLIGQGVSKEIVIQSMHLSETQINSL